MRLPRRARRAGLLLALMCATAARAQTPPPPAEVPIHRCDVLPVIDLRVDGRAMRFLVDTAAVSFLNAQSFLSGQDRHVVVRAWNGPTATSAREVSVQELLVGAYRLHDLKLPAIDLGPIAAACGGRIDGILGVDLLDKLGMTIDLKRDVLVPGAPPAPRPAPPAEMAEVLHRCDLALRLGDAAALRDCLDPAVVVSTPAGELQGRDLVLDYLAHRYLGAAGSLHYQVQLQTFHAAGDTLWYFYDYVLEAGGDRSAGSGVAVWRLSAGRWRILSLHNFALPSEVAHVP